MKNTAFQKAFMGGMAALLFACNTETKEPAATAPAPIDKEQIKKDIQAREDQFAELYNAGELKEIGYYADDAVSFYEDRPPLVGKAAIIDFLRSDLAGNSNKISFTTNDIFPSADGVQVVEVGHFKVVDSTNTVVNSGNYMSLFEKRDGKYVCLRDMSASDGLKQ